MRLLLFSLIFVFVASGQVLAGASRSTCKKFFPQMNLSRCEVKQDAAQRKIKSGVYDRKIVQMCIDSNKLVDRKSVYIDYIGTERCAAEEQARQADEYDKLKNDGTNIYIN
jgi:hypothetical protein